MNKKLLYVLGVVLVIIVIGACIFIPVIIKLKKSVALLGEGSTLIREGNYDEGLSKCSEMYYRSGICYIVALGLIESKNESIDKSFCDNISIVNNESFWASLIIPDKEGYLANVNQTKIGCYKYLVNHQK